MAHLDRDIAVERRDDGYRAELSDDWNALGPYGGYVAAVLLSSICSALEELRPAAVSCQFFRMGRFGPVDLKLEPLHAGSRSRALRVAAFQGEARIAEATAWMCARDMDGFEHCAVEMPEAPDPIRLGSLKELAGKEFEWWPSIFRRIDYRPLEWRGASIADFEPGPPSWCCWQRLCEPVEDSPLTRAARALVYLDMGMSQPIRLSHPWPLKYDPYNLDLNVQFHQALYDDPTEWMLCYATSPDASRGLAASEARLWTQKGRLVASGTATLLCRRIEGAEEAREDT